MRIPGKYCAPSFGMSSTNLHDAKNECDSYLNCRMFYDNGGTERNFFACDWGASIYDSVGSYKVLYHFIPSTRSGPYFY